MPKRAAEISLVTVHLDPKLSDPMYCQLYDGIRKAILTGHFQAGARLPATRALAKEFNISRNTVIEAFQRLFAEGYLEGKIGSGTYVSKALPDDLLRARPVERSINPTNGQAQMPSRNHTAAQPTTPINRSLSQRGQLTAAMRLKVSDDNVYDVRPFVNGLPALDAFPIDTWMRVANRCWRYLSLRELGYADPAGYMPLRRAVAERLRETRAVQCEAEQVIIVSGTQQAINLCAQLLLNPGDAVWLEDPTYLGARAALHNSGAKIIPVPVDADGLVVGEGIAREPNARMAFVSPSYQVPMCATMSLPRRLALLDWAARHGAWVIEDDYDSEFRYAGRPLASLQSLDTARRVIYIGTFSKSLLPALRMGYLIAPPDLVDAFITARAIADRHAHTLEQAIVADFIAEGHFAQHLRRMRTLYQERQHVLVSAAQRDLAGMLEVQPKDAGLNLLGCLPDHVDDAAVSHAAALQNISAPAISAYAIEPPKQCGLVLGYAALTPREIRKGIKDLARVLENFQK